MKKPIGLSLEIGKDKRGWFGFLGGQKFNHLRPTRHKNDGGKKVIFDFFFKRKYDERHWHVAQFGGLKIDIGIGQWRRPFPKIWLKEFWSKEYMDKEAITNPWNSTNHAFTLLPSWFLPLPYFFISGCYGMGRKQKGFAFGFKSYLLNKVTQGIGLYDQGDPKVRLYKAQYPKFVAWGNSKEAYRIYVTPIVKIKKHLVDNDRE